MYVLSINYYSQHTHNKHHHPQQSAYHLHNSEANALYTFFTSTSYKLYTG